MSDLILVIPVVVRSEDEFWKGAKRIGAFREVLRRLISCTSVKGLLVCSDSRVFKDCAEEEGASFVQMPLITERELPHLGPPGRRQCAKFLAETMPLEHVVMVNFRYLNLTATMIDAAVEAWNKKKGRLMTVRNSEDHPCQLFTFSRIVDVGYLTIQGEMQGSPEGVRLFRDANEMCSLVVDADNQARLFLEEEMVPQDQPLSLRLWWESEEGVLSVAVEDVGVGGIPFVFPQSGPLGETVRYVLESRVDSGEYAVCKEYPYGNELWAFDPASRQVRNLETGRIVYGRQEFPDVLEPDDAILIGKAVDFDDWDNLVEKGRVEPFQPMPPLGQAVCTELDYLRSLSAKAWHETSS